MERAAFVSNVPQQFGFDGPDSSLLLGMRPPIVHISDETEQTAMRWALGRMMAELRTPRASSDILVEHLSHFIVILPLRCFAITVPHKI